MSKEKQLDTIEHRVSIIFNSNFMKHGDDQWYLNADPSGGTGTHWHYANEKTNHEIIYSCDVTGWVFPDSMSYGHPEDRVIVLLLLENGLQVAGYYCYDFVEEKEHEETNYYEGYVMICAPTLTANMSTAVWSHGTKVVAWRPMTKYPDAFRIGKDKYK